MYGDFEDTNGDLAAQFPDWRDDWEGQTYLKEFYDMSRTGDYRDQASKNLRYHMRDHYGIEWNNWFDWDAYRRWYDLNRGAA